MHVYMFITVEQDGILPVVGFCPVWNCMFTERYAYTDTVLARRFCYHNVRFCYVRAATPRAWIRCIGPKSWMGHKLHQLKHSLQAYQLAPGETRHHSSIRAASTETHIHSC